MNSLVERIRARAADDGQTLALAFQDGHGVRHPTTIGELDAQARAVAVTLRESGAAPGDRALLIYPPGIDYIAGFLGCLYAGVVAVPVFPPGNTRGFDRVLSIAHDAGAAVALTDQESLDLARDRLDGWEGVSRLSWQPTDGLVPDLAAGWSEHPPPPEALAFLQYTSGSTAAPKGVMVTHGNLAHNSGIIAGTLGVDADTRGVSWLPPYHDMGLIGGILQPLYSGFPCLLMAPTTFLFNPLRWLRAVDEFGATASAAPDFAYAECVRRVSDADLATLDLSRWRHALVGAEPVRARTLDAFAERFAPAGFRREAFLPCYGLAEATLFVTGTAADAAPSERLLDREALSHDLAVADEAGASHVGCGHVRGSDLVEIVDPVTRTLSREGAIGEVWVSGPSVAAGYWNDKERTSEAFQARLAGDRERAWLRTGDLGFLDGAELYVTGRLKDLIVVRGANHYPHDIEVVAEQAHPELLPGRGAAFGVDDGGEERVVLVYEMVRATDFDAVFSAVSAAVTAAHGVALHEIVLVRRGSVPRTSSGKVRRRECRARYLDGGLNVFARSGGIAEPERVHRPKTTGQVERLLPLVAEALDHPAQDLDLDRPLVQQGMDSLRAARLRARLASELRVDVDLAELIGESSVSTLAATVADAAGPPAPIGRLDEGARIPASLGQERLWLLDELGAGTAYHVTGMAWLPAEPDRAAVREALSLLVERHEALRTVIGPGDDGVLEQVVHPVSPVGLRILTADDRAACVEAVGAWAAEPFRLFEPPLLRAALCRIGGGPGWALALCMHHIVSDGWSFGVLAQEFGQAYSAIVSGEKPDFAPLPVRYRDFAGWQRQLTDSEEGGRGAAFWRSALAGASPPSLPALGRESAAATFEGEVVPVEFPPDLVAGLTRVAEEERATLFMVLAAAYGVVLGRWANRSDVLLGGIASGRSRAELAGLVGFFAATLPLRLDLEGDPTVRDLVGRVRAASLELQRHQDVPFERIVRETRTDRETGEHRPLVRHVLVLQDRRPALDLAGAEAATTMLPARGARFDLELDLVPEAGGGLSGWLTYATDVLDRTTVELLLVALATVLRAVADDPGGRLSALPVMDDRTRELVVREFSGSAVAPTIHPAVPRWFEGTADAAPGAVAVIGPSGETVGYAEFDQAADRLAHRLRALGVGTEDRVGICLDRGAPLSVALLAVLKAGGVYVPLDPGHPTERIGRLLADSAPAAVISTSDLADRLTGRHDRLILLDEPAEDGPAGRSLVPLDPAAAAYVLYTSGSTGRPKGAVNTHGGLTNRLRWAQARHPVGPGDRVLQKTPISFDVSVWELLLPLVAGAALVYAKPDGHRDSAYLHELIDERSVTVCHFVPSMLRAFLETPSGPHPSLRKVICSGEELPAALAREFLDRFPQTELENLYGPTEAAIDVTAAAVVQPVPSRIPIGTPVPGAELYVLDHDRRPQPIGVPGELFIGGVQMARGYLGAPGSTAERFVPHPFSPGERLYATGDGARWRPDGSLEYLGRLDQQVKIRGQRVEPGEIEAVLAAHPEVAAAAVVARRDRAGEVFLAAYAVARTSDQTLLRDFLVERLPAAMVPAVLVLLDELPMLPNGKVDRNALPDAERGRSTEPYVPPASATERELAEIWSAVLGVERVGVHDGFFELGGHSLLAVRVLSRIKAGFGVDLKVADLLTGRPTVARLAGVIEARQLECAGDAELDALLSSLEHMSEDEVRRLLGEE